MYSGEARFEEMVEALRRHGLRLTPQRLAIVRYLAESRHHPSAEQVLQAVHQVFPTTSVATVYKTVSLLQELGQAMELRLGGPVSRYDGVEPTPHPHVVCEKCGEVVDAGVEADAELARRVEAATGYHIETYRVDFFGVCPRCRGDGQ